MMATEGKFIRKKRFLIPVLFLLICGAMVAGYWYLYLRGYVSTDDAYIDGDPVSLSSKISGRVRQLTADEGDTVKQEALLVQLDDSDLRAQEAQSAAALEYARQTVALADVNLQKAQEDFNRSDTQFKESIIPKEQFDHARQAVEVAQAQKKVALAQVNNAQAQLDVIRTQLQNTRIIAPMTGVVARKWLMPGDITQPGQPILTIYDLQNVWITANFEETKLESIRPGDLTEIGVDAYPGHKFTGKVVLIGAAAASQFSLIPPNNASGNFTKVTQRVPVKISIINPESVDGQGAFRLLPGMSVEVRIKVKAP